MPVINELLQQGRYRITQQFGQDAFGAIYEAFDNVSEKNVLLKEFFVTENKTNDIALLETDKIASDGDAKILIELKHESLSGVSDYFSEAERQYLVLESIEGISLSELLEKRKKSFTVSETTNWAEQLLDALYYLHNRTPSIIHRDVKPQNIKLTSDGKIKLLAFGNSGKSETEANRMIGSQMFDPAALPYSPLELIWGRLDRASQNVITNSYDEKSEQILNLPADARSDVYSLGATLYHLLTARIPIDALERSIDILEGKIDPLPAPSRINPKIPSEISFVVMKALEIKRENRFESALVMRQVLRTAVARADEREIEEAKKQENILEIPFAEPKKIEPKRQLEEQKRQTELIKQQLRESEANRLKAEQRAAEAEKRLIEREKEREKKDFDSKKSFAAIAHSAKTSTQAASLTTVQPKPIQKIAAVQKSPDDFKDLFAQPAKNNNKIWRRMAATVLIAGILGGGFFGFQSFQTSKTAELNQSELNQAILEKPEPVPVEPVIETSAEIRPEMIAEIAPEKTPENPTATKNESTPETSETEFSTESPNLIEPAVRRPTMKNKAATVRQLPVSRFEKAVPPVKTQPKPQKKVVTVDDIINDN